MKKLISLIIIAFTLSACSLFSSEGNQIISGPTNITMWVVVDSPSDYDELKALYSQQYPSVTIDIKKFRLEDYENELLDAFAEDRGPDIFMVHNTWIRKYLSKIEPLPPQVTISQAISTGAIKKEIVIRQVTLNTITPFDIRNKFVDVIAEDVIIDERIYSVPLYMDTLALYYNKDLLNNAGIAQPPQFWDQYQTASTKLTKINSENEIVQAGSALGTAKNIENAPDILAVLMMQNGTDMYTVNKSGAAFHRAPEGTLAGDPSAEALRFYSDFALPQTTTYTWNESQEANLEAFTSGQLAFFIGYAYHLPIIKSQTLGKLHFSIAPLPQIQGRPPVNIASYWTPVVSKKSQNKDVAWSFIQTIASSVNVPSYLERVQKPSPLRDFFDKDLEDPNLFAFSGQSLHAKNWYYGIDPQGARVAFEHMISNALIIDPTKDRLRELRDIITNAAAVINQSYR